MVSGGPPTLASAPARDGGLTVCTLPAMHKRLWTNRREGDVRRGGGARRVLVATLAATFLLAACSDDGGGDDASRSTTTVNAPKSSTTQPTPGTHRSPTTRPGDSGSAELPALHAVRGARPAIVDEADRQVILRGVNVNSIAEYAENDPDLPPTVPVTEADFESMAAEGFNVVRLLVSWSRLEPERGEIDAAYLREIRSTVRKAAEHGIYSVIDMHQDAWSPYVATPEGITCPKGKSAALGWDGAPKWATPKAGRNSCIGGSREDSDLVRSAWDRFYADTDKVQSRLVAVWRRTATTLAAEPGVAGYDLLNEPNDGTDPAKTPDALARFYVRAIAAIRAGEKSAKVDAKPIYFEYGVNGAAVPKDFSDDPGLVFAPHIYGGSIAPLSVEANWDYAQTLADGYQTALWPGEWGWFEVNATNLERLRTFGVKQDQAGAGGAWWQWRQACGDPHSIGEPGGTPADVIIEYQRNGCPDDENLGVIDEWREVVTRAYPRAAPGRIVSLSSDGAERTMSLRADGARTGTIVDVWVPGRATPSVTGQGIAGVDATRVEGGWRVRATVCSGAYQVFVGGAGQPATSTPPQQCTAA